MSFIFGFLGACIGIIVAVAIIIICIVSKLNNTFGSNNISELINAARNSKNLRKEEYAREKSVSGMTKLLEPLIREDFPDFNKDLLYKEIENNLLKVFNAIEQKSFDIIKKDEKLELIYPSIKDKIQDLQQTNTTIRYNNVKFHRHAISNYQKEKGMATITTSSTLEYYYSDSKEESYDDVKKQTRYTCKFVYIYDEKQIGKDKKLLIAHCPNCGAPVNALSGGHCEYCMSNVEPINLKLWKMSSYKEDYN